MVKTLYTMQGARVQSLVEELRSHMVYSMTKSVLKKAAYAKIGGGEGGSYIWGTKVPDKGNGQCKCLEAGTCLVCL